MSTHVIDFRIEPMSAAYGADVHADRKRKADDGFVLLDVPDDDAIKPCMMKGIYEAFELDNFCESVLEGDVVIDVGACIGIYSAAVSRKIGDSGKVIAVEPEPSNLAILRKNISTNELTNVMVIPKAASDRSGMACLWLSGLKNAGDHCLYGSNGKDKIDVETCTIDEIAFGLGKVTHIKIDTQGWEPKVIRGASKTIDGNPKIKLQVECYAPGLREAGSSPEELMGLLFDRHKFNVFAWKPNHMEINNGKMMIDFSKGYTLFALDKRGLSDMIRRKEDFFCNLWCTRG